MERWVAEKPTMKLTSAERKAQSSSVVQRRDWVLGRMEMGNMPKGLVLIPFVGVSAISME